MIAFILKSSLCLGIIYLLYMMLLAKENMPVFKRCYLLFGLLFSVLSPLLTLTTFAGIPQNISPLSIYSQTDKINSGVMALGELSKKSFSGIWLMLAAYSLVSTGLFIRYIANVLKLIRLQKMNTRQVYKDCRVVLVDSCFSPYSFLNTIYVNKEDYEKGVVSKEVWIHERAHVKQKHSIDILLIEFWQVIFWFNPLLWLYKREIKLNHEYLADGQVVQSDVTVPDYQRVMLGVAIPKHSSFLISPSDYSFIKNRLIMLTKKTSISKSLGKSAILTLLMALLFITVSCNKESMSETALETTWWYPLLTKHNIVLDKTYYATENTFEMGKEAQGPNQDIRTLTKATLLLRMLEKETYLLVENADTLYHNFSENTITTIPGNSNFYKTNADSLEFRGSTKASAFVYQYSTPIF